MQRGRISCLVILACIVCSASACASTPAGGAARSLSSKSSDGWTQALQDKLEPWVKRIYAVVGHDSGYADVGLDFATVAVEVYYHGSLPSKLDPIIAEARSAGVGVEHREIGVGAKEFDER